MIPSSKSGQIGCNIALGSKAISPEIVRFLNFTIYSFYYPHYLYFLVQIAVNLRHENRSNSAGKGSAG